MEGQTRTQETMRYLGSRLVTTVLIVFGAMLLLSGAIQTPPSEAARRGGSIAVHALVR